MAAQCIIPAVVQKISLYEPISLAEMDGVKLMNRVDAKFLVPLKMLPALLEELRPYYRLLEIDGHRMCEYETLYFDTPDLRFYHDHQAGRLNRYKIRQRRYVHTNTFYTEVKFKNNKRRTIKTRIPNVTLTDETLSLETKAFLREQTPFDPAALTPVLWVDYTRLTLVSRTTAERLTLDLNLSFRNDTDHKNYEQIVVAEVKQDSLRHSHFVDLMKKYHLRQGSLSKYCLGVISLDKTIKHNRFKEKLKYLSKITARAAVPVENSLYSV
ncbi:polyphosphate polymerase domain-containing protein [Runella slithyformis]|uniref:VTC domain-containing protein n=1 Tax=Runella slithyformis (strain ATCC 29530 / DSM 19594 / LMG 11500 / NCIMB 11436 / LSU 4) TaxID=761193 RepID=A0A7U3ZJR6_RUNSL|nr:polyphosphate polymerase domain-containing protein [Runella slithyformis]AEI48516.1 VTC domain-containing protein [Runella slithyformis DSM 19594]